MAKTLSPERIKYKENSNIFKQLRLLYGINSTRNKTVFNEWLEQLKEACNNGFPVDFTLQNSKTTLLEFVVRNFNSRYSNTINAMQALIDLGADVDHISKDGDTLLTSAARGALTYRFKLLIKNGANPNICNKRGDNALTALAEIQWLVAAEAYVDETTSDKYFYDMLSQIENINHKNNLGQTALGIICRCYKRHNGTQTKKGMFEYIKALLDAGADPEADTGWLTEEKYRYNGKLPIYDKEIQNFITNYLLGKELEEKGSQTYFEYEL